jgi:hypothetical protein
MSTCANCGAETFPGIEVCEECWFYAHTEEEQERIRRETEESRRFDVKPEEAADIIELPGG